LVIGAEQGQPGLAPGKTEATAAPSSVPLVRALTATNSAAGLAARGDRTGRLSAAERLEQMKKDSPEQFAEIQKRREEYRQAMVQRAKSRADFLAAVETKNMSDEQRKNHVKLVATVARVNELAAKMMQADVERTVEMRRELSEAQAMLGDLYAAERRFLFEEKARAFGCDAAKVSAFADQIQAIIDNTSSSSAVRSGSYTNQTMRGGAPASGR
jgi:hypothetical protein